MRFSCWHLHTGYHAVAWKIPELILCEDPDERLEPAHQDFPPESAPGPGGSRRAGRLWNTLGARRPTVGFGDIYSLRTLGTPGGIQNLLGGDRTALPLRLVLSTPGVGEPRAAPVLSLWSRRLRPRLWFGSRRIPVYSVCSREPGWCSRSPGFKVSPVCSTRAQPWLSPSPTSAEGLQPSHSPPGS